MNRATRRFLLGLLMFYFGTKVTASVLWDLQEQVLWSWTGASSAAVLLFSFIVAWIGLKFVWETAIEDT